MKKLKLQSPDEVAPNKTTVLLYGPASSGKSTFGATWPGPYYIVPSISVSEIRAIEDMGFKDNIVVFDSMREMLEQSEALVNAIRKGNLPDCHTVIFDNLTSAQMMVERELIKGDAKDSRQEWGVFAKVWTKMVEEFHNLPVNVIWITHSKVTEIASKVPGAPPTIVGEPALTGKSKDIIPTFTDQMFYCESIRVSPKMPLEFRVWLKQHQIYPARVRGNIEAIKKLPDYLGGLDSKRNPVQPHYDQLADLLGWPSQYEVETGESQKES